MVAFPELSLGSGAIRGWDKRNAFTFSMLSSLATHYEFDIETTWEALPEPLRQIVLFGSGEVELPFFYLNEKGRSSVKRHAFEGVIPNLERFPEMGRPFLARQARSVETTNSLATLRAKLSALTPDSDALREYVLKDYLLLYAPIGSAIYLLAIRHQRQLSFDFEGHWGR